MSRKNSAAVKLGKLRAAKGPSLKEVGRLGGLERGRRLAEAGEEAFAAGAQGKGGAARAAKLTAEQRSVIAKKAAAARWGKK